MGEGFVPSDMWALSESKNGREPIPLLMNLLENPSAVQFDHRILAYTTITAITGLWAYSRTVPLPPQARLAVNLLMGVGMLQVGLGITTLIYFVPVPLAAAHQGGSLTLLSAAIYLRHVLKRIPK